MAKNLFTAIVERASDGFGVFFPDLPGCVSAGDTFEEAIANGKAALALHLQGMAEDGESIPRFTLPDAAFVDDEVDVVAQVVVEAEWDAPKTRFNVMLDKSLVSAIDAVSENRSRFLTEAAMERLATMTIGRSIGRGRARRGAAARKRASEKVTNEE